MADHQITAGVGRVIKPAHQSILGGLVKVDHHVAAENHIELDSELDGVHQVEGLENDVVSDLLADGVPVALYLPKIFLSPGGGQGVRQLINALFGLGHGFLGNVGSQDAGVPLAGLGTQKILYVHRQVIGLLPAGAAGAPDGQHLFVLIFTHQFGQNHLGKKLKVLSLPHEKRVVGGQTVEDLLDFLRISFPQQLADELGKVRMALLRQQGGQPAGDQLALLLQRDTIFTFDKIGQFAEIFIRDGRYHPRAPSL